MPTPGRGPRARFEELRARLAAELEKDLREWDRDLLHGIWQALLRLQSAGRAQGKRCCGVCRAPDLPRDGVAHERGCALAAALVEVEAAVRDHIFGRRVKIRATPIRFRPEAIARLFELDGEQRGQFLKTAEGWQDQDDLPLAYAAIDAICSILEIGLRARGRRQRAEARRERPRLLAELVLAGAVVESKLPPVGTPEQWQRLVRKGAVGRA